MTFENGGSLRASPSATRRFPGTPGKMSKRVRLTNALPMHRDEDKNGDHVGQHQTYPQRKLESSSNSRRYSCPHPKGLISAVYREKPSPRSKTTSSDLSLTYPTPEINFDFLKLDAESDEDTLLEKPKELDTARTARPFTSGNCVRSPRGDTSIAGNGFDSAGNSKWRSTLLGMRNSRRYSLPVTTLERQLETSLTLPSSQAPVEKNEAEIIEDTRRGSLEDKVTLSVPGAATLRLPGRFSAVGIGRSASMKGGRGDSINR